MNHYLLRDSWTKNMNHWRHLSIFWLLAVPLVQGNYWWRPLSVMTFGAWRHQGQMSPFLIFKFRVLNKCCTRRAVEKSTSVQNFWSWGEKMLEKFWKSLIKEVNYVQWTVSVIRTQLHLKNNLNYAKIRITRRKMHWFWSIWPENLFGLRGVYCTGEAVEKISTVQHSPRARRDVSQNEQQIPVLDHDYRTSISCSGKSRHNYYTPTRIWNHHGKYYKSHVLRQFSILCPLACPTWWWCSWAHGLAW